VNCSARHLIRLPEAGNPGPAEHARIPVTVPVAQHSWSRRCFYRIRGQRAPGCFLQSRMPQTPKNFELDWLIRNPVISMSVLPDRTPGRITSESPDLLIVTDGLPDVENLPELLQGIRKRNAHVYIIVLLAGGSGSHCLNAGADDSISRDDTWLRACCFPSAREFCGWLRESQRCKRPLQKQIGASRLRGGQDTAEGRHHPPLPDRLADRHGGMGEVYEATDLKLGRRVALKVLPAKITRSDEARRRLVSEAARRPPEPSNIVTIHSIEQWQSIYFIVMEYIEDAVSAP